MDKPRARLMARAEFANGLRNGLVTTPVLVECPGCHRATGSAMPWCCGYCSFENHRTSLYSFLYKCERCDAAPKSLECPNCRAIFTLDDDRERGAPARSAVRPAAPPPQLDANAAQKALHEEEKERLRRQIELEKLRNELRLVTTKAQGETDSPIEKLRQEIRAKVEKGMASRVAIAEERKRAAEEFKDQPEMLQDANDLLDRIQEDYFL